MNVNLLFPNKDYKFPCELPKQAESLKEDLELQTIFQAMAGEDEFLMETVRSVVLLGLESEKDILYRQGILKDCFSNEKEIKSLYDLACSAAENEIHKHMGILIESPRNILEGSIKTLEFFVPILRSLAGIAKNSHKKWQSEGFLRFFQMIDEELSDAYLVEMEEYLKQLKFPNGMLVSAKLGKRLKADSYILHKIPEKKRSIKGLFSMKKEESLSYTIGDKDESGYRILSQLKDEGVKEIASVVSQSCDHVRSFFMVLRRELSFYIGCMNLAEQLKNMGCEIAFPSVGSKQFCENLYDISLALQLNQKLEGNTLQGDGKQLVIITGANQGGKTTFLRSMGQAKMMFQSGMFIPGTAFQWDIGPVFTHFKREEDAVMKSGKLDEELERMSQMIDWITPGSLLLMNESFAATNEQEGSEIAMEIIEALLKQGVSIMFVTHFYKFARACFEQQKEEYLFLRADRQMEGMRSYKLKIGEPLTTGFGEDIYHKIFHS